MSDKPIILVVDDDAPILLLMRNLLREFGFEVIVATNGSEALDKVRSESPALVLLDKNMPGMSGDEVIRALRGDAAHERLPVLIVSGEPVSDRELASLGANGAVMKPFDVPALIEQIRGYVAP